MRADLDDLTGRELRVLDRLCEGMTDKEIGHAMGWTPGYAQNVVNRLTHRLGARNRVEAAVRYTMLRHLGSQ